MDRQEQGDRDNDVDLTGRYSGDIDIRGTREMFRNFIPCPACGVRARSTVYLPCSHLGHCHQCTVPTCPTCGRPVRLTLSVAITRR